MTVIHQLSATALAHAIRNRQIRAVDAVAACFEQIKRHNDRLKAMITLCRERAEAEAMQADCSLAVTLWGYCMVCRSRLRI